MLRKALFLNLILFLTASILTAQQITLYEEGLVAYREKSYSEAIEYFEEFIRLSPSDVNAEDAKWRIGKSLVYLDRLKEAEPFYRELSSQPGNRQDDARFEIGKMLYDSGSQEESLGLFQAFILDFPESTRVDDAYWYIGRIHMDAGRNEEAERAYLSVIGNTDSNRRDEALYGLGYLQYTENQDLEAIETFTALVTEYPDDSKVDDSMWRIGRIHMRQGRDDLAELMFETILDFPISNRFDEASYDLGRIHFYSYRDYIGVTERFSPLLELDEIGLYQEKSIYLGAKAYYSLGLQAQRGYQELAASEYFKNSIRWFEHLLEFEQIDTERADILTRIGMSHDHLYELSSVKETADEHLVSAKLSYGRALELLDESMNEDVQKHLSDIKRTESPFTTYDLLILGGYETLVSRPGAMISAEVSAKFPVGFRNRLSADINFDHEDLSIKTFNFDSSESGTDRLISRNDRLALDFGWRSGSRRFLRNDFNIRSSYRWAEDPGDNRFLAAVEDSVLWRINSDWRFDTDLSAMLKIYPDYLSGTNKIDSFTPAFNPRITYYGIDDLAMSLEYEFNFKQYLQSAYGTSSRNKQYLTNSAAIEIKGYFGVFRPSIKYEIAWLKSYNYDLIIAGLPVPQYVEAYWDNITNSVVLDLDFRWSSRFRTTLSADFDYRAFAHYPARDETNTFTGELRKDLGFELSMDISYVFIEKSYTTFSSVLQGRWIHDSSNMLYDSSIATNFDTFGVYVGVQVERR